ncbi:MAG: DUF4956 domain-containing protein [Bacteroidetes bacterium]|nr:DUF4956 domain-containing protein [Bacteroidota bacterium]MBP7398231.1 DUF4956 domain-containing protein [Chitinophagales bacterium]MBK7109808.1 DUF4956 domain-containing protein [Bacteroidota bacterium]MBK8487455.1 DUF4956 domain-containing protein [Bacteroidota bacterium]MBK8682802.1 DUF4956 domain-containing protein [Bacteroidota bacterium]
MNELDSLNMTDVESTDTETFQIMDIKLYDDDFIDLFVRFFFNLLMTYLLLRFIYRSDKKNKNYVFTYYVFSTLIFFLCYMMNSVKLSLGFAFGLFAVFSILRYRTISIPMKEMTYLFLVIGISVINALTTKKVSFVELLFTNVAIISITVILERLWYREGLYERVILYEKIENIKPENRVEMLEDLRNRTGLDIREFDIVETDFVRDIARLRVYYKS